MYNFFGKNKDEYGFRDSSRTPISISLALFWQLRNPEKSAQRATTTSSHSAISGLLVTDLHVTKDALNYASTVERNYS